MAFGVDRIDHVVLNCRDVDATTEWYVRVLGMHYCRDPEGNLIEVASYSARG